LSGQPDLRQPNVKQAQWGVNAHRRMVAIRERFDRCFAACAPCARPSAALKGGHGDRCEGLEAGLEAGLMAQVCASAQAH